MVPKLSAFPEVTIEASGIPLRPALFACVTLFALHVLAVEPGMRIIDIGCGCGDTTIELARRTGPAGKAVGIDISRPMVERARRRGFRVGRRHRKSRLFRVWHELKRRNADRRPQQTSAAAVGHGR